MSANLDVLASRYASPEMATLWSSGPQGRPRAPAVDRGAARTGRPRRGRARRRGGGVREGPRRRRPGLDPAPRAGDPPRREGAHRGVQRARRARAHPQGHDLARPHRERRAAAGARLAADRARPGRGRARPAGAARRRVRRHVHGRALPQRRRPGDHARQALRERGRRDCCSPTSGSRSCSRAIRCAASRARSAPRRTCSTCSTATRTRLAELEQRIAGHLGLRPGARRASARSTRARSTSTCVSALVQVAAGAVAASPRRSG